MSRFGLFPERAALGVATLLTGLALGLVPWADAAQSRACYSAMLVSGLLIVLLYLTRRVGPAMLALEKLALCCFLAGMPLVYLANWVESPHRREWPWLWVEAAGAVIFGSLGIAGYKTTWLLAAGIVAHGLLWDAWHYGHSPYLPNWYAVGCLLVDLGVGLYAAARIPAWRSASLLGLSQRW